MVSLVPIGMSRHVRIVPERRLPGIVNYFIGKDPSRWRVNIPTYAAILYKDVYPGISLRFYGGGRGLEYDWLLHPGADPSRIRLHVEGATVRSNADGSVTLGSGSTAVRQSRPQSFSLLSAVRHPVQSAYVVQNAHEIRFRVGPYSSSAPLVIDPTLVYATYLGGGENEGGYGLTVDAQGNAYVTGDTQSTDFPLVGAAQGSLHSDSSCVNATIGLRECPDAFVSKLSADGHTLLYSTYVGGSLDDYGHGVAVDSAGNAYLTGNTLSSDFPVVSAIIPGFRGGGALGDSYITKLNAQGNAILFSTFLGGAGDDDGEAIVESAGSVYVAGTTNSPDFPTAHPWQKGLGGGTCVSPTTGAQTQERCSDAFVAKLPDSGASLTNSTHLGGSGEEIGTSIAVANGSAYVTGSTSSSDYPTTHPLQGYGGGTCGTEENSYPCNDGFLTVLAPSGDTATMSTYVGGSGDDVANDVAVGPDGAIYVVGSTRSPDFPLVHPLKAALGSDDEDAFIVKIGPAGTQRVYSTYFGGSESDDAYGVAVDGVGDMYVTGSTLSQDFPVRDPIQSTLPTVPDVAGGRASVQTAYISALTPDGSDLLYSTYFGDSGQDEDSGSSATLGADIAVDGADNAYITGFTMSHTLPVTAAAFQSTFGGVFVAKIHHAVPRPPTPVPTNTATPSPTHTPVPTRTPVKKTKKCKKGYKLVRGKCKKAKKKIS